MGNIFSASEIVGLGIQIEKNGRDFYNAMAGKTKDPKAKDIFEYLSSQEERHIEVFQEILSKIDKYEVQGLDIEQYSDYMKNLAGENIFTSEGKGKELAAKAKSDKEAIDMGVKAEKDSIVFYEEMKKMAPDYDQKAIDEVIAQEQAHLKQLTALKGQL